MKSIQLFLLIAIFLVSLTTSAQFDQALMSRIQGKTRLSEIMREVNNYINPKIVHYDKSDPYYRQLKKFYRWAHFMSYRLTGKGDITNVSGKIFDALKEEGLNTNSIITNSPQSSYGGWSFIAPTNTAGTDPSVGIGRIDRIAFHPTDPNTIYVGTPAGGLWKSTNDGGSWSCISNNLPTMSVSGIVVDHNNPNIIYVLTGEGDVFGSFAFTLSYASKSTGVYKTTDGGATWAATGPLANSDYVGYKLVQDPNQGNTLLAATSEGVYRTTDGGISWNLVTGAATFYDIEYDPDNADRVYASAATALLYSLNSGATWNLSTVNQSLSVYSRNELAVSPNNPNYVYMLSAESTKNGTPGYFEGVFRSTDNGLTYTRRCNTPNIMGREKPGTDGESQGTYDNAIAISPTDANKVITGGINIWSSSNGGSSFTDIMFDASDNQKIHTDIHDLKFNPLNGALYCANDGGFYKSTDNGGTWTKISSGLNVSQIYDIAGVESNSDVLAIGLQDNGVKSRTSNTSVFNHNSTGDGLHVKLKHDTATKGYCSINERVYTLNLNGGTSAFGFSWGLEWMPTLAIHPTISNTCYAGWSKICKTTNGGASWSPCGYFGTPGAWAMTTCPSSTTWLYAASGDDGIWNDAEHGELRRSENGGDDFTTVFNSSDATFNRISDVTVHPSNASVVWVTLGGYIAGQKIYRSTDAGINWVNISGSLPNVAVLCVVSDNNGNIYIGTDIGVYYRAYGGTDWSPFYNGMPRVPVTHLLINHTAGLIRASTFGRGIYSASIHSNCVPTLTLNGNFVGNSYYEASSTITSAGNVLGGVGTQVYLKAGSSITFTTGFDITDGNELKAYLGNCGNGVPGMNSLISQLPAPATLNFAQNGFIEIKSANGNGCTMDVYLKNTKPATIVIGEVNGQIVYSSNLTSNTTSHVVKYKFEAGKQYRAMLFMDGELVHWQELYR